MNPVSTLEGRLLCASGCAYGIVAGEATLEPAVAAPYYNGAGFISPPATFAAGPGGIDAALVGVTADGIVVAFRGTLPLSGPFTLPLLLDWINDLNEVLVVDNDLPGRVHQGFLEGLEGLWKPVQKEVARLQGKDVQAPILLTGHSKGGSVAALAALRCHSRLELETRVVTFAAPKPGDRTFADAYNAVIAHDRYEYADDVVPHLPPSGHLLEVIKALAFFSRRLQGALAYDYARVGRLHYITEEGRIIDDPYDNLLASRRQHLIRLLLTGHVHQLAVDHSISCGAGYLSALCPQGVCFPQPVLPGSLETLR